MCSLYNKVNLDSNTSFHSIVNFYYKAYNIGNKVNFDSFKVNFGCKVDFSCKVNFVNKVKGAGGGLWVPTFEIEFLGFLQSREQELPAAFYRIKKYCS